MPSVIAAGNDSLQIYGDLESRVPLTGLSANNCCNNDDSGMLLGQDQ
ncbi:MAG: hypothetical protein HOH17_08595 [Halieaceae bacterium]|nr:hypothetical protein [Halieaceae bacterium]